MAAASDPDEPDWLGASRRAATAIRAMLADRPTIAERVQGDGHARRGRRPDAADRRSGRGRGLRRARGARVPRALASPRSARSAASSTSARTKLLVVIDPIDGSTNAKRGLPHFALSIAVADGPTMADVVVRLRAGLRARGGVGRAPRRGRARSTGCLLDPTLGERRTRDGKLEVLGRRVGRPALGRPVRRRARRRRRTGCARSARSPSRCARSRPRASTRWRR